MKAWFKTWVIELLISTLFWLSDDACGIPSSMEDQFGSDEDPVPENANAPVGVWTFYFIDESHENAERALQWLYEEGEYKKD